MAEGYFFADPSRNPDPIGRRQDAARRFAQQIMGQPAQTAAQGWGQLAAGIGLGIAKYRDEGQAFPQAPGGGQPSFLTGLANFVTGRQNGGLY